uniref:Uncharacterized protein n=1 Tax=Sexangularia sp. CB-2014 TaxID=1486929 RepID=A0A7S1VNN6_9EUKA
MLTTFRRPDERAASNWRFWKDVGRDGLLGAPAANVSFSQLVAFALEGTPPPSLPHLELTPPRRRRIMAFFRAPLYASPSVRDAATLNQTSASSFRELLRFSPLFLPTSNLTAGLALTARYLRLPPVLLYPPHMRPVGGGNEADRLSDSLREKLHEVQAAEWRVWQQASEWWEGTLQRALQHDPFFSEILATYEKLGKSLDFDDASVLTWNRVPHCLLSMHHEWAHVQPATTCDRWPDRWHEDHH